MSLDHFWFNLTVKEKKLGPLFLIIYVKTYNGYVGVRDCRQPRSPPVEFKQWICSSWTGVAACGRADRTAAWSEAWSPSWGNLETNKNPFCHVGIVFFSLIRLLPFSLDTDNHIVLSSSLYRLLNFLTFTVNTAWAGGVCIESMDCRLAANILLMSLLFLHSKGFSGNFFKDW